MSEPKQPEVKILAVSNVYCRLMEFKQANDFEIGHYHHYDHGTLLAKGKIKVEMFDKEDNLLSTKEFTAPSFLFIKKDNIHKLTALEDGTVATCIHALRTIDEEIVDPDFFVEETILDEKPKDARPPEIVQIFNDRGMLYQRPALPKDLMD